MEGQLGERLAYPPRGGAVSGQVGSPGSALLELEAGDRLEVEPGTEHAATVGPDGVKCMEAAR